MEKIVNTKFLAHEEKETKRVKKTKRDEFELRGKATGNQAATLPSTSLITKHDEEEQEEEEIPDAKYNQEWEKLFPWLYTKKKDEKIYMFCRLCEDHKQKSKFTHPGSARYKLDTLKTHNSSYKHQKAIELAKESKKAISFFEKTYLKSNRSIVNLMFVVSHIVKNNQAINSFRSTGELINCVVGKEIMTSYCNYYGFRELLRSLSDSAFSLLVGKLRKSKYFSLIIDESTDITTTKTLIMYVRYFDFDENQPKSEFFALLELTDTTAKGIYNSIKNFLESKELGLGLNFIVGLATDGASVMTGKNHSVMTLLDQHSAILVHSHCVAHKLNLATKDSYENSQDLFLYDQLVKRVYRYFAKSHKKLMDLKEWFRIKEVKYHKILRIYDIRWLARFNAVSSLKNGYGPVLECLDQMGMDTTYEMSTREKAKALYQELVHPRSLYLTFVLYDVLGLLARLSKAFQDDDLLLHDVLTITTNTINMLKSLYLGDGFQSDSYLEFEKLRQSPLSFVNQNKIIFGEEELSSAEKCVKSFVHDVIENLEARFFHREFIQHFKLLDIKRTLEELSPENANTLFHSDIMQLRKFYAFYLLNHDDSQVGVEYQMFKHYLITNYKLQDVKNTSNILIWKEIFTTNQKDFINLFNLIRVMLIVPSNSCCCERGFSRKNLIKTRIRNSLKTQTICQLMMVHSIELPANQTNLAEDEKSRVLVKATEDFLSKKTRYLTKYMETNLQKIIASK
jgi:hypothetical protein